MTYSKWLPQQTQERQEASLVHMDVCKRLGEEQRRAPHSQECEAMRQEVAAYYDRWKDAPT